MPRVYTRIGLLTCLLCVITSSGHGADISSQIANLSAPSYTLRLRAANELEKAQASAAVVPLLTALETECRLDEQALRKRSWKTSWGDVVDASRALKRSYYHALSSIGPQAADTIRRRLQSPQLSSWPYLWMLLARYKDNSALQPVVDLLRHHPDGHVRALAASALGRLGNQKAIPALEQALKDPFVVRRNDTFLRLVRETARGALHQLRAADSR